MSIREQLGELKRRLVIQATDGRPVEITSEDIALCDQLIAERPYEPGDQILVRLPASRAREWHQASFVAMHHSDSGYVWASINGGPAYVYDHKPLPKTYRVTVPEEIMEKAKRAVAEFGIHASTHARWLANPDNWEADDE